MTSKPPSEIQTLIEDHIKAFNTQDTELFHRVFGDTAIIIDGIAPYRWSNPNAPANWLADVRSGVRTLGFRTNICRTRWGSGMWRDPMRTLS